MISVLFLFGFAYGMFLAPSAVASWPLARINHGKIFLIDVYINKFKGFGNSNIHLAHSP